MENYKANLLGLLCSDGNYREYSGYYFVYDKRRLKTYKCFRFQRKAEFANTDFTLLNHFKFLLNVLYDYNPNITRSKGNVFRVCISKNFILDDITKIISLGKEKWFVPHFVLIGNKNIKKNFLRGYFDGDGCVDFIKSRPRIRFSSVNLYGLNQVKKLLNDLGIKCTLNGPYKRKNRKDNYELLLSIISIEKFIKSIGSNHPKKIARFETIILPGWPNLVRRRS